MKLKFLHRRGTEGKRIRIPFAFKTAAVYTLLFSLILVGVVVGLTSAYTTVAVRSQNLDRLASFVAGRFERPKAPGGLNADTGSRPSGFTDDPETGLDSFAEANRIYVEIKDNDTGVVVSYGEKSINVAGHMDTIRRVNSPSRHLMVRVVSSDSPARRGFPSALLSR